MKPLLERPIHNIKMYWLKFALHEAIKAAKKQIEDEYGEGSDFRPGYLAAMEETLEKLNDPEAIHLITYNE